MCLFLYIKLARVSSIHVPVPDVYVYMSIVCLSAYRCMSGVQGSAFCIIRICLQMSYDKIWSPTAHDYASIQKIKLRTKSHTNIRVLPFCLLTFDAVCSALLYRFQTCAHASFCIFEGAPSLVSCASSDGVPRKLRTKRYIFDAVFPSHSLIQRLKADTERHHVCILMTTTTGLFYIKAYFLIKSSA